MGPSATDAELKAAYRERARKLHPDAAGNRTGGEMAALNEAWRVLRDPARRAEHDALLEADSRARHGSASLPGSEPVRYGPPPGAAPVRVETPGFSGRGLVWIGLVVVMLAIFVFTAFAGGVTDGDGGVDAPAVDGYLTAGSCVRLVGESVSEVSCDVAHDGVVETSVRADSSCPQGTLPFLSSANNLRICITAVAAG